MHTHTDSRAPIHRHRHTHTPRQQSIAVFFLHSRASFLSVHHLGAPPAACSLLRTPVCLLASTPFAPRFLLLFFTSLKAARASLSPSPLLCAQAKHTHRHARTHTPPTLLPAHTHTPRPLSHRNDEHGKKMASPFLHYVCQARE